MSGAAVQTQTTDSATKKPEQGIYQEPEAGAEVEEEASETEATAEAEPAEQESQEQEATASDEDEASAEGPPEAYEWNLPEGMELDEAGREEFEPMAREWGLTQKQLDQAIGFYAGRVQNAVESVVDAMMTQAEEHNEANREQALKLIGKGGEQDIARAIEKFAPEGFREAADKEAWGNAPLLAVFMQRVGKALAEDSLVTGDTDGPSRTTSDDGQPRGIYA